MGSKTAILSVRVVSDTKDAKKGMDDMATGVEKLEAGLDKATVPAGLALGAIAALGKGAYDAASDLQQSAGAVESVFKDQSDTIIAASKTAADAVGLSTSSYQNLGTVLGAQLKNIGMPMDEVAGQTTDLISLGADLAATFGGETSDAVSAVSALLRGERDPIERYGVSIKQADINARMAADGLTGLSGDAAKAAETQTVLAMLAEQTSGAMGQFARETDSAAGSQQIANAQWENARAELGERLLPIGTQVSQWLAQAAQLTVQHSGAVTILVGTVAALAAGILLANGVLKAYQAAQIAVRGVTMVWTAAQWLLNAALTANPVGIVVVAIAALAAGLVVAYQKSDTFRNYVNRAWDAVKSGASAVWNALEPIRSGFESISNAVQNAYNWVKDLFSSFTPPSWLSTVAGFVGMTADNANPVEMSAGTNSLGAPSLSRFVALGSTANSAPAQVVHNEIVINGALDPVEVSRQLQKILGSANTRVTSSRTIGASL